MARVSSFVITLVTCHNCDSVKRVKESDEGSSSLKNVDRIRGRGFEAKHRLKKRRTFILIIYVYMYLI